MAPRGVNQHSGAMVVSIAPDVCLTPMGGAMVPVPYDITAKFDIALVTNTTVAYGSRPAFTMASHLPRVEGDEAGTGGGIISGVNLGCCHAIEHSDSVTAGGHPVIRHDDLMAMNCASPQGPGNTFGRIVYPIVSAPVVLFQEKRVTTHENGMVEVEEWTATQDPETGEITQTYRHTLIDPASGSINTTNTSYFGDEYFGLGAQAGEVQQHNWMDDGSMRVEVDLRGEFDTPMDVADPELEAALAEQAQIQAEIDATNEEIAWEAAEATADVAGLIDPTPTSDTVAAGLALRRRDYLGAGLSLLSWIPYLGDAIAKPIKAIRATKRGAALALRLRELAARLEKAKDAAKRLLKRSKKGPPIPEGQSIPALKPSSVDDVLEGAQPGRVTKGRTKQFEKSGGSSQVNADFDSLSPINVREYPGGVRVGTLSDGRTAIVRPSSSSGSPTLEIQEGVNRIKVRYID